MGETENKMKFGDKLKSMRIEKNLEVNKLAELLGIENTLLEDIESGEKDILECGLSVWLLILTIFSIKHEDLVNQTDLELNLPSTK